MDIVTQKEFEDRRFECGLCADRGFISVPNGDSDSEEDFCSCAAGERLQREEGRAEAYDQHERFDVSAVHLYPFHQFSASDL
jgi:hypothetical protein